MCRTTDYLGSSFLGSFFLASPVGVRFPSSGRRRRARARAGFLSELADLSVVEGVGAG